MILIKRNLFLHESGLITFTLLLVGNVGPIRYKPKHQKLIKVVYYGHCSSGHCALRFRLLHQLCILLIRELFYIFGFPVLSYQSQIFSKLILLVFFDLIANSVNDVLPLFLSFENTYSGGALSLSPLVPLPILWSFVDVPSA